jgi:hypothetical protein
MVFNKVYRERWLFKKTDLKVTYLQYVRYLYDFIIGIAGSRKYALQIRENLNNFIKNNLHLEVKKDSIFHRNEKSARFLEHFISFRGYKLKTSVIPKSIWGIQKNKHKSISKFLEMDKRLAKAKSYQFYSNVLKQFEILSNKLDISVSDKSQVNVLASIIAYKYTGLQLMKKISINSWKKFDTLLSSVNFYKLSLEKKNNFSLIRWFLYLQEKSDKFSKLSARSFYDNILLFASSEWYIHLNKGQASEVQKLQQDYLVKMNATIRKFLTVEIKNKWNQRVNSHSWKKNRVGSIHKLLVYTASKPFLSRVCINAPIQEIFLKLRWVGYIHPIKCKSTSNFFISLCADSVIITHFNELILGILSWYSGVINFNKIKSLAQLLRISCILTFVRKHKKSVNWVQTVYGRDVTVFWSDKKIQLKSRVDILTHRNELNLKVNFFLRHIDQVISFSTKRSCEAVFVNICSVVHCSKLEKRRIYSICRLYQEINNSIKLISLFSRMQIKIIGFNSIVIHINRKRFYVCSKHYIEFKLGTFSFLDYLKLNKVFYTRFLWTNAKNYLV